MASFERLQGLGTDKFTSIKNELMRGTPAMAVARMIQQEWKDYQDVAEKTLTQQLNRMRIQMVEGAFGSQVAEKVRSIAVDKQAPRPIQEIMRGVSVNALQKMEELVLIQRERVLKFSTKEKDLSSPMPSLNTVVTDYSSMLQTLQKMRFDLGADEFLGVSPGTRAISQSVTLPDGTNIQKQMYEAVETMESIFNKRGIPQANEL